MDTSNTHNKRHVHALIAIVVFLTSGVFAVSEERLVGNVLEEQESAALQTDADRDARRSLVVQRAQEEIEQMRQAFIPAEEVLHAGAPAQRSVVELVLDEIARWFGLRK